jgi:hypothetical protein
MTFIQRPNVRERLDRVLPAYVDLAPAVLQSMAVRLEASQRFYERGFLRCPAPPCVCLGGDLTRQLGLLGSLLRPDRAARALRLDLAEFLCRALVERASDCSVPAARALSCAWDQDGGIERCACVSKEGAPEGVSLKWNCDDGPSGEGPSISTCPDTPPAAGSPCLQKGEQSQICHAIGRIVRL